MSILDKLEIMMVDDNRDGKLDERRKKFEDALHREIKDRYGLEKDIKQNK